MRAQRSGGRGGGSERRDLRQGERAGGGRVGRAGDGPVGFEC